MAWMKVYRGLGQRSLSLSVLFIGVAVAHAAGFSHRVHLQMGLDCTGCHAAAVTSTKPSDNLLPAKSVCLDCHESVTIPAPPVTPLLAFSHALHLKMGNV